MALKIIINRDEFPECIRQYKEVRGIAIGGCIFDIERSQKPYEPVGEIAHCHTGWNVHKGFMCSKYDILFDRLVLLHEAAHLITGQGHTKKWKEKCLQIGGTLGPGYVNYNGKRAADCRNICEKTTMEKASEYLTRQSNLLIESFKHHER